MKLETKLKDRVLRFDGVSVVHPDEVAYFIYRGVPPKKIQVTELDDEISQFNMQVSSEDEICKYNVKAPIAIDLSWQLPDEFVNLDLREHFMNAFERRLGQLKYSDAQFEQACQRIEDELELVDRMGMVEFMRTVIYIIHKFRETDQVWGVGRGSSCASYLLFLIGLHVVDCVKMDVPLEEFFHE